MDNILLANKILFKADGIKLNAIIIIMDPTTVGEKILVTFSTLITLNIRDNII